MKLEKIEIHPRILPEKTLLFIRSLEYKYAKAFIERDSMRFAKPSEWVPDGTSRGDSLEGVYASQRGCNVELDVFLRSLRENHTALKTVNIHFISLRR